MDDNPYVWDDSFEVVTTPVVTLEVKSENLTELALRGLKYPIDIFLSTNREYHTYMYINLSIYRRDMVQQLSYLIWEWNRDPYHCKI